MNNLNIYIHAEASADLVWSFRIAGDSRATHGAAPPEALERKEYL